jgi:uncharacterized protein
MKNATQIDVGSVASLWRYPVKSMLGEELSAAEIASRGLCGDRNYALVDASNGKVVSAKNPRKWPQIFEFHAALAQGSTRDLITPPVCITLPNGVVVDSREPEVDGAISNVLGRPMTLAVASNRLPAMAEEYGTNTEGFDYLETVTEFRLLTGTFFDSAFVHLLTTATLGQLHALYPQGRFEVQRFRPNIFVETPSAEKGFVEETWVGKILAIGDAVRLSITRPCVRCVMTTLPQADLPQDPGILRTAARHNKAQVGVYASVLQGGTVRRGDPIRLEE